MKIEISRHPNMPDVMRNVLVQAIEYYPSDSALGLRMVVQHTLNAQPWPLMPDRTLNVYVNNEQKVRTLPNVAGQSAQRDENGTYPADAVGEYEFLAWSRQSHGDGTPYSFSESAQAIAENQVARLDARGHFNA